MQHRWKMTASLDSGDMSGIGRRNVGSFTDRARALPFAERLAFATLGRHFVLVLFVTVLVGCSESNDTGTDAVSPPKEQGSAASDGSSDNYQTPSVKVVRC